MNDIQKQEAHLGWLIYAAKMPVECCGTPAMKAGWWNALGAEANAMMMVYLAEVSQ